MYTVRLKRFKRNYIIALQACTSLTRPFGTILPNPRTVFIDFQNRNSIPARRSVVYREAAVLYDIRVELRTRTVNDWVPR